MQTDLETLEESLIKNPKQGDNLGGGLYKVRLAAKSKGKGKSGGARVITYIVTENNEVYLLTIYDKAELDAIDDKSLKSIIKLLNTDQ